jgi:hypothetical protein
MIETLPQAVSIWRHPRRWGFITFNLLALAALVSWIVVTQDDIEKLGVFGLPYYALGYLGIAFLVTAWIASWLAWIWMVMRRRRRA